MAPRTTPPEATTFHIEPRPGGAWQTAGWHLTVYPDAGEAVATFVTQRALAARRKAGRRVPGVSGSERARQVAEQRARTAVRRYAAANGLDRLGTLTYGGDGCHDPRQVRQDAAAFFKALRRSQGGSFPYVWVPEWHSGGHGLHLHFAVARYLPLTDLRASWRHGFVHIKRLRPNRGEQGEWSASRTAARYLSKYIAKSFDKSIPGLHRYEVGQGFAPRRVNAYATSLTECLETSIAQMGGVRPSQQWSSGDVEEWAGPPVCWMGW